MKRARGVQTPRARFVVAFGHAGGRDEACCQEDACCQEASPAAKPASTFAGFGPGLFDFFTELALDNDREWFEADKARYEAQVRGPALAFIRAMAPELAKISKSGSDRRIA